MGKRCEQTILQRGYTNGQQAYEKMPNITNYMRNANQKYNELTLHIHQDDHYQSNIKVSGGKDAEKLESLHISSRNEKWYSCYGKLYGGSSKN